MPGLDYGHAVYAGSFDPITLGHTSLIERASRLYNKVTVATGINVSKSALFTFDERVKLMESAVGHHDNVEVCAFEGLLVDFTRSIGAGVLLRGLRMLTDFESEFQYALANRDLSPEVETVFLMTNKEHVFVSSSLVKEIAANSGDFSRYVPAAVLAALRSKYDA